MDRTREPLQKGGGDLRARLTHFTFSFRLYTFKFERRPWIVMKNIYLAIQLLFILHTGDVNK